MFDKVMTAINDDSFMKSVILGFLFLALTALLAGIVLGSTGLLIVAFLTSLPAGGITGALLLEAFNSVRSERLAR